MQYKITASIIGAMLLVAIMQLTPISAQVKIKADANLICEPSSIPQKPLPLGTEIKCTAIAHATKKVNTIYNDLHVKVHDPMDKEIYKKDIPNWKDNTPNDDDSRTNVLAHKFSFKVDKAGTYKIWANFTNDKEVMKEIHVSVFVLPESPLGAVALIGASIAVFAVFMHRQKKIIR
jgi:hypothetical protein